MSEVIDIDLLYILYERIYKKEIAYRKDKFGVSEKEIVNPRFDNSWDKELIGHFLLNI